MTFAPVKSACTCMLSLVVPTPKYLTDVSSWSGLVNQMSYSFSMANCILPFRELLNHRTHFNGKNKIAKSPTKSPTKSRKMSRFLSPPPKKKNKKEKKKIKKIIIKYLPAKPPTNSGHSFQCFCADYFYFKGHDYLVFINSFSSLPIMERSHAGAIWLIFCLRRFFVTYGIPEKLASEGGSQFTAINTRQFFQD